MDLPTNKSSGLKPERTVTILHFNDVYNIEARSQEPVGGATRFATAMRQLRHLDPLVLFSGDAFNPSLSMMCSPFTHLLWFLRDAVIILITIIIRINNSS